MSRIAGFILDIDDQRRQDLLQRMLVAQESGLPCFRSTETQDRAAFGRTGVRSAQIALSSGIMVVLDGLIYNRTELGGAVDNDAELIARLYLMHGFAGVLERINGDFAVACYDSAKRALWLGRDRFGVRPLYYVVRKGMAAFASRPGALLGVPGVTSEINRRFVAIFAASHYRYFDNEPGQSPYAQIKQVPAAHLVEIKAGEPRKSRYWALQDLGDLNGSEDDLAERYRDLLLDAISIRLKSVSRPAFTLSGGMDSSSVLSGSFHLTGERQHAFSTVYDDKTYDESQDIRPMLDECVKTWHPVKIGTPDVLSLVREMVRVHDEPVATATWLSHYQLCREVSAEGFCSLFGGLGGDELNAGEYEYFFFHFADLKAAGRDEDLRREVEYWVRYHDHPVYRKSVSVMEDALKRLADPARPGFCRHDSARLDRYRAALSPDFFDLSGFAPVMDHPFKSCLKNRTFQDIFRETAPCCLRAEDRQARAFGLDNVLPFFDYRLVEFMFRVRGDLKIRNGVTKHLLRKAVRGILPEETRTRIKKTGWNAPAHLWFSGQGKEQLLDLVRSQGFRTLGVYRAEEVERLIGEHDMIVSTGTNRENHMMFLWQLVNLATWLMELSSLRGPVK